MMTIQSSANPAYLSLCELTDAIVAEWRGAGRKGITSSRPAAFQEACERRPDLRDAAIYPGGGWVNAEAHSNEPPPSGDKAKPKSKSVEDLVDEKRRQADEKFVGIKR